MRNRFDIRLACYYAKGDRALKRGEIYQELHHQGRPSKASLFSSNHVSLFPTSFFGNIFASFVCRNKMRGSVFVSAVVKFSVSKFVQAERYFLKRDRYSAVGLLLRRVI